MTVYPKCPRPETLVVIFDCREEEAVRRLHSERAGWRESGTVEALDEHHYVLIIRPGGARKLAA